MALGDAGGLQCDRLRILFADIRGGGPGRRGIFQFRLAGEQREIFGIERVGVFRNRVFDLNFENGFPHIGIAVEIESLNVRFVDSGERKGLFIRPFEIGKGRGDIRFERHRHRRVRLDDRIGGAHFEL